LGEPALFQPIQLRKLELANRVVVSPMCQYSGEQGLANDWHLAHIGSLSMSGAGLLVIEATDVEPQGALTPGCLSLHSDEGERALARVVDFCHRHGTAAVGLQLTHSGRKAACNAPWVDSGRPLPATAAWPVVGPSSISYGPGWPTPQALDTEGLSRIRQAFADAARRAARIGVDCLELHAAHGYLLHQFLTPLSNQRDDLYGGDAGRRMRFPLEVFSAVRDAWPAERPLGIRISGTDWVDGGQTIDDAVEFARKLTVAGCDFICVSSGGLVPGAAIKVGPGYQVPLATAVRKATCLPVRAVGLISDPHQAEQIVASGEADMVALARAFLDDPRWAWHAAATLGATIAYPREYERCHPGLWPGSKHFAPGDAYLKADRFMPRGLGS
jgi:2,4-dienoyl-CoA reductase-like NADH-dependent reductase (Old Yellow Enzyme family)